MTKKYLCICSWGNVRSVAMAQFIKELNGKYANHAKDGTLKYEAIAIGNHVASEETINMLKEWADEVINITEYLPKDLWHNPRHKEIMEEMKKIWKQLEEKHHSE